MGSRAEAAGRQRQRAVAPRQRRSALGSLRQIHLRLTERQDATAAADVLLVRRDRRAQLAAAPWPRRAKSIVNVVPIATHRACASRAAAPTAPQLTLPAWALGPWLPPLAQLLSANRGSDCRDQREAGAGVSAAGGCVQDTNATWPANECKRRLD